MRNLKLGIVLCGALGLVGMVVFGIGVMLGDRQGSTIVMLIAFVLPMVMAVAGLVKPPLQAWQAGVSLACFVLELFKLRAWEAIAAIGEMPVAWWLMLIGAVLGVILSLVAVIRPEARG